jgi:hypothetical protein
MPQFAQESVAAFPCSQTHLVLMCADLGGGSNHTRAPCSSEEGARSIAWNVEHKQPEEISGRVWRHGKDIGF